MDFFHRKNRKQPKLSSDLSAGTLIPNRKSSTVQGSTSLARSRSISVNSTPNTGQPTPITKKPRNLWREASDSLNQDQRDALQYGPSTGHLDVIGVIDSVTMLTEKEYKECCTRGWHITKGDRTKYTNVRIQAKEILYAALQFKDIIDPGLKFDPSGYGTMVSGVWSTGLQLIQNDADRVEAVFISAAAMANILPKYTVVEAQYRDRPLQEQAAFEDRIVAVYNVLLIYAAEATKELDKSLIGQTLAIFWTIDNQTITVRGADLASKDQEATDMLHLVAHQQRRMEFSHLD